MNSPTRRIIQAIMFGFIFAAVIVNVSRAQSKVDKIDKLVQAYADYGKFNGSVLVADKGKLIYKKGFGLADMEWNVPNRPDTKHRLGSITKQFTAMLIMQLVEQGKLKLDVPISTYLPDYPKKNGDVITIHHLLTHTSGTPNMTSFRSFTNFKRNPFSPAQLVNMSADSTLDLNQAKNLLIAIQGTYCSGILLRKSVVNHMSRCYRTIYLHRSKWLILVMIMAAH